jgi:hypothetical protein
MCHTAVVCRIPFNESDRYFDIRSQMIEFGQKLLSACHDETVINKLEAVMSLV